MSRLNINTTALVKFTNKLEKIHRSALPSAVRSTLNDAVFDVKTRTMPQSARAEFTQRQKNFFTANSKFERADGFQIERMRSTVGFYENKLRDKHTNYAVRDLEEQEVGGSIDGKTFIPTIFARKGNNNRGLVRPNARIKAIRNKGIVDSRKSFGKNRRQKFVVAANSAPYIGTPYVLHNNILFEIKSVDGKKIKAVPLYTVKKGRSVRVQATSFMREASLRSAQRLDEFYVKQAQRQIKKFYGRL